MLIQDLNKMNPAGSFYKKYFQLWEKMQGACEWRDDDN
jgi:hypothetical protein